MLLELPIYILVLIGAIMAIINCFMMLTNGRIPPVYVQYLSQWISITAIIYLIAPYGDINRRQH